MLAFGIPLIWKAKVQFKKKLLLLAIFSLGIFVILAAVLNKYYNFSNPLTTIYMLWYIRESSTAIYVSNIPMLWPLFRKAFKAGSFAGSSHNGGYDTGSKQSGNELSRIRAASRAKQDTTISTAHGSYSSSQEQINKVEANGPLEIETRVSFTVEDAAHYPVHPSGFDVERYGDAHYKASISAGNSR